MVYLYGIILLFCDRYADHATVNVWQVGLLPTKVALRNFDINVNKLTISRSCDVSMINGGSSEKKPFACDFLSASAKANETADKALKGVLRHPDI